MKGKNKLVLEKYLSRSKTVRMRTLRGYDMAMAWVCACLTLGLGFDPGPSSIPIEYAREVWKYGLLQMAVVPLVLYAGHPYAIIWGVSGIREMMRVLLACLAAALAQSVGILLLDARMLRSYYTLWFTLMVGAAISGRVSFQVLQRITDRINRFLEENTLSRVMIIDVGKAGTLILKEMKASERVHGYPVCIIDDDKNKQGRVIDGVPIMGSQRDIARLVKERGIDETYVTTPAAPPEDIRDILKICQGTGYQVKMLPGMYQFMNGEITISGLRKVEIEDLLGKESVNVNLDEIMGYVKEKVALVTGGGGSIGSELCRQPALHKVRQLIIFDTHENNVYEIQRELKWEHSRLDLVVLIGSVRNMNRFGYLFRTYRLDIVYHAAAHKHVPLMEGSSNEAIKNNVPGTHRTAGAATKYRVQRFILISMNKAVNPMNTMGASKRLCEMVVQMSNQKSSTELVAVRFGSVLGSNGSVTSLFKQQIENGDPVIVTHKDIIRYFMITPEAVNSVIQAGAYAKGGEIFVLGMGNPVRTLDMAENLIRLSGYEPYKDMDIHFTGLRPGEKLYEEFPMDEEGLQRTVNDRIFVGKPIDMDYGRFEKGLQCLGEAVFSETVDARELVHDLVPGYHYKNIDSDIIAAKTAASWDFEVTLVNPERFAVHKKIAMYNLGVK